MDLLDLACEAATLVVVSRTRDIHLFAREGFPPPMRASMLASGSTCDVAGSRGRLELIALLRGCP